MTKKFGKSKLPKIKSGPALSRKIQVWTPGNAASLKTSVKHPNGGSYNGN